MSHKFNPFAAKDLAIAYHKLGLIKLTTKLDSSIPMSTSFEYSCQPTLNILFKQKRNHRSNLANFGLGNYKGYEINNITTNFDIYSFKNKVLKYDVIKSRGSAIIKSTSSVSLDLGSNYMVAIFLEQVPINVLTWSTHIVDLPVSTYAVDWWLTK